VEDVLGENTAFTMKGSFIRGQSGGRRADRPEQERWAAPNSEGPPKKQRLAGEKGVGEPGGLHSAGRQLRNSGRAGSRWKEVNEAT